MAKLSSSNLGSRKNLIINGAFMVAQRGTSHAGIGQSDGDYYLDQWEYSEVGTPVGVITISQDVGHLAADLPFDYAMKIDCTTAEDLTDANHHAQMMQRIEAQNLQHLMYGTADAKVMTLSFYTKGNKAGTMCVCLTEPDGTRQFIREVTLTGDGNWEKITTTFPGDASGTIDNNNGAGLHLRFSLSAGSAKKDGTADIWQADSGDDATSNQTNFLDNTANDLWFAGVQLEVGPVATEFEHRTYEEELAICSRYLVYVATTSTQVFGVGYANSTSSIRMLIPTPTEMRSAPSLADISLYTGAGGDVSSSSITEIEVHANCITWKDTLSGATTDRVYVLRSSSITLSAEL
jgi:hypothetical protein